MYAAPSLLVIPAMVVSFRPYKIYPWSGEPVVVVIMIRVTPIVIVKPLGVIGRIGVSLSIYIIIRVIITSITGEPVIISIIIRVYIPVVIIVVVTIRGVLIMVIRIISISLVPTCLLYTSRCV